MKEIEGGENGSEKKDQFVMPTAYCAGCDKELRLKPLTLYVRCSLCGTITQIIRQGNGYITMEYTGKKKLRESLIDNEAPNFVQKLVKRIVENAVKLKITWEGVEALATLNAMKENDIRESEGKKPYTPLTFQLPDPERINDTTKLLPPTKDPKTND